MRILIWCWGRRGGGPHYTTELARSLASDPSLEIHLSLSKQSEFFEKSQSLGLPGWHVDTYTDLPSALISSLRIPYLRLRFLRYLREQNIQLVYCTMSHLWNPVFVPLIHCAGARYVFTLHDALPHPGDYWLSRWRIRKELRRADGVIVLSEHVRKQLCHMYGFPCNSTTVIPHGVFEYGSNSIPRTYPHGRSFRILFFGRILKYKGPHLLMDAYRDLRNKIGNIELAIVGQGDISLFGDVIRELPGVIIDNRWIDENDIGNVFADADLLVLPYIEASQSGVIAIAYGAGVPVVATSVGGLTEQVIDRQTGLLAKSTTGKAIADAILELVTNPKLYEHCSAGALRMASDHLSWQVIGRQVASCLKQFL